VKTVIFDLDGTLADTSADLIEAANACFRALGHGDVLDPAADARTAFRGAKAMLRLGFSRLGTGGEPEVEREYERFMDFYTGKVAVHSTMYPGAVAAVERLRAAGIAVGICTNKPGRFAEALLVELGVRDLFDSLVAADTLPVRKPDPAPLVAAVERAGGAVARAMLVGDTETDRATARAAGMPCALVTFGPDGRAVETLEPEGLVEHFDRLDAVVAALLR
jgi:phosphoglycolate phosphatase